MKKLISVLLTMILALSVMTSVPVSAYLDFDFSDSGCIGDYEERPEFAYNDPKDGTNVTYTFDEQTGTLTIVHHSDVDESGKMASFGTSPFADNEKIKHLIVKEGVTGFCKGAFRNCIGLLDVSLPSTMTEIADEAFFNCYSLKSVELRGNVKKLGNRSFEYCDSLKELTLNNGLEVIDNNCFMDCIALENVTIPKSVTEIFSEAFCGSGIKSLVVEDSECIIYPEAFNSCKNLTTADLGNKATLKAYAFSFCTSLKSVNIPGVNESIPKGTFYSCTSLENIKIGDGVKSIGEAFNECEAVKTIEIPKTVTSVGSYVFRDCKAITDVYYAGTKAEWEKIDFGYHNETLTGAKIHYGSRAPVESSCGGNHKWNSGVITKKATPTSTGIKTFTCTVCGEKKTEVIPKTAKYQNTLTVKAKNPSVKYSKLKKKNQTIALKKAMTVSKAQGALTYTKSSGSKKISIDKKTGKITVKKGLKKSAYKIKIKVKAAGNASYKPKTKTVTVTLTVK